MKKWILFISIMFAGYANGQATNCNDRNNPPLSPLPYKNYSSAAINPPIVLERPQLEFPDLAKEAGVSGSVTVKVWIGEDGKPYKTVICNRDPEFLYLFDEAAQKWAMKIKFSPATDKEGKPVKTTAVIPVKFALRGYEPPTCKEQAVPKYPKEALEMGMEGWVGVAVVINDFAKPDFKTARVMARSPQQTTVFDEAALEVARNSLYTPAKLAGRISKGWAFIKVEFKLGQK
jgi:TonB family protein